MAVEIPYPPVFHDWHPDCDARIATVPCGTGVEVQMMCPGDPPHVWPRIELTEDDATLLAASLLQRAGRPKLAKRVLKALA